MSQSDEANARVKAGWFPDPQGGSVMRYWDGSVWTAHTSPEEKQPAASAPFPIVAVIAVAVASFAWFLGFVSSNAVPAVTFLLVLSTIAAVILGAIGIVHAKRTGRGFTTSVVATVMGGLIVVSALSVLVRG